MKATGLCKTINGKKVIDNIDFIIEKNSLYGLISSAAGGKSVLLGMLTSLVSITSGNVRIFGYDIKHFNKIREKIGYMPQHVGLFVHRTAMENVLYFARLHGMKHQEAIYHSRELFGYLGLSDLLNHSINELSFSQQRLVCLAQALVDDPELVFLDEPFAGLDAKTRKIAKELIIDQHKSKTFLIASNDLAIIDEICTEIGVLYNGKLFHADNISHLNIQVEQISPKIFFVLKKAGINANGNNITCKTLYPALEILAKNKVKIKSINKNHSFGEILASI